MSQDTIFALSSGAPPAGIAVFRASGPGVRFGLETLVGRVPPPRRLVRCALRDPGTGEAIDEGLVVFFPKPASFTGEDMAELHLHGGAAVITAAAAAIGKVGGFRLAERGEFSRRAFENGKLDLAAAEGLADIVAAETEMQRRQAMRQAAGAIGAAYEGWRQKLITARAMIEAELDFGDGEDLPGAVSGRAWQEIETVRREINAALEDGRRGERLREGIDIVILGRPNAGKSSLLNALARRDAAIVSADAGTTRDLIEVRMDLEGYPVTLIDTAGIREAGRGVEREGVRRAMGRAREAEIALILTDCAGDAPAVEVPTTGVVRRVATKIDLVDSEAERIRELAGADFAISAVTGAGIPALLTGLAALVAQRYGSGEPSVITRKRHRDALAAGADALSRAQSPGLELSVVAEELRRAGDALAGVTGRIDVEDWLDVVFREFCIGK